MSEQTTTTGGAPRFSTASCGSCPALVVWADSDGGRIAFDADPVAVNGGGGTHLLMARSGQAPYARKITNPGQLFGKTGAWRRHNDTCPYRGRYRGGRAVAAASATAAGISSPEEYQVVRRYARGASVDAIRIATSMTADFVSRTVTRVCRFDRDRARELVARYEEVHPEVSGG